MSILLSVSACFAGEFALPAFMGLGIPTMEAKFEESSGLGTVKQTAFSYDVGMLITLPAGFTIRWACDVGLGIAKEIKNDIRCDFGFDLGAGWAFVNTDRFLLAATASLGFGFSAFKDDTTYTYSWGSEDIYGYHLRKRTVTTSDSWGWFQGGAELTAIIRLGDWFALYGTVSLRKVFTGSYEYSQSEVRYGSLSQAYFYNGYYQYHSGTIDAWKAELTDGWRITPAFGIALWF